MRSCVTFGDWRAGVGSGQCGLGVAVQRLVLATGSFTRKGREG